jgi:uncharacterized damage-inducible protein DinB
MTNTTPSVQEFFVSLTEKQAKDLVAAFDRLPADKRHWEPTEGSRSAANQLAECAILNGSTAKLLETRTWDTQESFEEFFEQRDKLAGDDGALKATMEENLPKIIHAIRSIPTEDLDKEIAMPWGNMKVGQIITYPYWNMAYHEGQVNYIATMLGVEVGGPA